MATPKRLSGDSPLAGVINWLIDQVSVNRVRDSSHIRVSQTQQGIQLSVRPGAVQSIQGATTLQRFKITAVNAEYLLCRKVNQFFIEESASDFKVARPISLRVSFWNGRSRNGKLYSAISSGGATLTEQRNVTFQNVSGIEEIDPEYAAGDEIYAFEPTGETGVVDQSVRLTWMDVNVDGRHWVMKPKIVKVCTPSGQLADMLFLAGNAPV